MVRAGIQAIPKGQTEAALSLGMDYYTMMRKIILPQALVIIIAPVVGELVMMIQGTSLLSIIAYTELTRAAEIVASNSFAPTEGYLTSAFLYLIIGYSLMFLSKYLEKMNKIENKNKW
jgi:polar amino acid transport system permease protein